MYLSRARQLAETSTQAPLSLALSTFNVPTCSVGEFIGRKTILENLKHTLYPSSSGHNRAAVLHGMGGQGKTQTALEFCRRATLDRVFECIYWIDCSTKNPLSWILKLLQARWLRTGPNSLMPMPPSSTQRAVCPTQYRLGCSFSTILMIHMFSKTLKAMSQMCWQTGQFYTSVAIRILHDLEHPSLLKE